MLDCLTFAGHILPASSEAQMTPQKQRNKFDKNFNILKWVTNYYDFKNKILPHRQKDINKFENLDKPVDPILAGLHVPKKRFFFSSSF